MCRCPAELGADPPEERPLARADRSNVRLSRRPRASSFAGPLMLRPLHWNRCRYHNCARKGGPGTAASFLPGLLPAGAQVVGIWYITRLKFSVNPHDVPAPVRKKARYGRPRSEAAQRRRRRRSRLRQRLTRAAWTSQSENIGARSIGARIVVAGNEAQAPPSGCACCGVCASCGNVATKVCGKCRAALYCSEACQVLPSDGSEPVQSVVS